MLRARQGETEWLSEIGFDEFRDRFLIIKDHLREGAAYQVNYSFRLHATYIADLPQLFASIVGDNPPPYASLFLSDDLTLASLSPELFFERSGGKITSRPMKGTARRGTDRREDNLTRNRLQNSAKERAENLMVVDMIRNDLGKIAQVGTVKTTALFEVERFSSVLQMTSTVEAEVGGGVSKVFKALFPCASIVGAPKVATMEIIRELESGPRGVYTGAIGWVGPRDRARFSVGIRTISKKKSDRKLTYGVGSGIVWDSGCEAEWKECQLKAEVLQHRSEPWALLETMSWTSDDGYFLLDRHLERLKRSAVEFGIPFEPVNARSQLLNADNVHTESQRVRLKLSLSGDLTVSSSGAGQPPVELQASPSKSPVASTDPGLFHKTTWRQFYIDEVETTGLDEAVLWNERGEVTEFCNGNLVALVGGSWLTPPLKCGLLPGTFRAHLIDEGEIHEEVILLTDLKKANKICRINSVNRWVEAKIDWADSNIR